MLYYNMFKCITKLLKNIIISKSLKKSVLKYLALTSLEFFTQSNLNLHFLL